MALILGKWGVGVNIFVMHNLLTIQTLFLNDITFSSSIPGNDVDAPSRRSLHAAVRAPGLRVHHGSLLPRPGLTTKGPLRSETRQTTS